MMNVIGAPVNHTTYVTNPESSVTTTPPKYFDPATETVKKNVATTTDTTPKGIFFYILNSFELLKLRMLYIF